MAEPLPDIVPMPDEVGPSVDMLRRNAQWSDTFAPSDTSLAQRARGNADKMAYANALLQQRSAEELNERRTNKAAQDLYFRNQKLEMDRAAAQAALNEREQRMQFQQKIQPEILNSRKAQTAAALALERSRLDASNLKASLAQTEAADTMGFQKEINAAISRGIKPRTPQFEQVLLEARVKHPAVTTEVFDDVFKFSGSTATPEEIVERVKIIQQQLPGATVSATGKGDVRATIAPPKQPTEKEDDFGAIQKDKETAEKLYGPGKVPEFVTRALEERGRKIEGTMNGATSQPAQSNPQASAAMDWLEKNPNDPRAAAVRAKLGLK